MWLQKAFDFIVHIVCFVYRDVYHNAPLHSVNNTKKPNRIHTFHVIKVNVNQAWLSLLKIEIFCSFPPFLIKKWRFTTLSRWTKMENFGCKCLVVNPAQILYWPFTVRIDCSSDPFSWSLEHFFFLTVGQNNFGNKIPFPICIASS